jgi:hypothetical protein
VLQAVHSKKGKKEKIRLSIFIFLFLQPPPTTTIFEPSRDAYFNVAGHRADRRLRLRYAFCSGHMQLRLLPQDRNTQRLRRWAAVVD